MSRLPFSEITQNELKAMALVVLDTFIVAAMFTNTFHYDRYTQTNGTTSQLGSYALVGSLPLACIFGRCFHGCVHDRILKMMVGAFAMSALCAVIANSLFFDNRLDRVPVCLAGIWAPTALLVLVYERWSRPPPPIPFAILPSP